MGKKMKKTHPCLQALVGEVALIPILAQCLLEDPNTTTRLIRTSNTYHPHHISPRLCHRICFFGVPSRAIEGRRAASRAIEGRRSGSETQIGFGELSKLGEYAKDMTLRPKKAFQYLQGIEIVFTNKVSQKTEVEQ